MNAIMAEFSENTFVRDGVKCLREIKGNKVSLGFIVNGFAEVMSGLEKLSLSGVLGSETMLGMG